MTKNKSLSRFPPLIFNVFKPARMTSYDCIRHFKRHLPNGYGKIGHFGTLDPFASGVLLIGIGGAARLNDLIHDYLPKTYMAVGKLGIETPTGDYESEIIQRDQSAYLRQEIASFSSAFIGQQARQRFLGDYWQAPHKYSAAKFMGRNLHEWAREGVDIKKEPVLRHIYDLEVVKYCFPYLTIRVTVSSGTYVRTLFSDLANHLGTIGSLIALSRESVGVERSRDSIKKRHWPHNKAEAVMSFGRRADEVLRFKKVVLTQDQTKVFKNGGFLRPPELRVSEGELSNQYMWMLDEDNNLLGLGEQTFPNEIKPKITFHSLIQDETASDRNPE